MKPQKLVLYYIFVIRIKMVRFIRMLLDLWITSNCWRTGTNIICMSVSSLQTTCHLCTTNLRLSTLATNTVVGAGIPNYDDHLALVLSPLMRNVIYYWIAPTLLNPFNLYSLLPDTSKYIIRIAWSVLVLEIYLSSNFILGF